MTSILGGLGLGRLARRPASHKRDRPLRPGRRIYVAIHRPHALPTGEGYVPIHAGKAVATVDLGLAGDDSGDQISALSPYFSEISVLYWLWKNTDDAQTGLLHYRRYFAGIHRFTTVGEHRIAAADDFHELDAGFDLVVGRPIRFGSAVSGAVLSLEQQYVDSQHGNDLLILRRTIATLAPDYLPAYDFVMRNHAMSICNLFVGQRRVVERYCAWLFPLLFAVQAESPYLSYELAYRRAFGTLSERLLNVWIAHNWPQLRVAYRPVLGIGCWPYALQVEEGAASRG